MHVNIWKRDDSCQPQFLDILTRKLQRKGSSCVRFFLAEVTAYLNDLVA